MAIPVSNSGDSIYRTLLEQNISVAAQFKYHNTLLGELSPFFVTLLGKDLKAGTDFLWTLTHMPFLFNGFASFFLLLQ